jgi:hypothetical protein
MKKKKTKDKGPRPKAYKKYISGICDELRTFFFCGEYRMDIVYVDEIPLRGGFKDQTSNSLAADIKIDPTYLNFTMRVSDFVLRKWEEKKYREIAEMLVHEFTHLLTEPLYLLALRGTSESQRDELEDVRERQTERTKNVLMCYLPESFYKAAKIKGKFEK